MTAMHEPPLELRAVLAFDQELRAGIEAVRHKRAGTIVVMGCDEQAEALVIAGNLVDKAVTAEAIFRGALLDCATILNEDCSRIIRTEAKLYPDPRVDTTAHGMGHTVAEQFATQTGCPVVAVSEERNSVTLYSDGHKYILREQDKLYDEAKDAVAALRTMANLRTSSKNAAVSDEVAEARSALFDLVHGHLVELGKFGLGLKLECVALADALAIAQWRSPDRRPRAPETSGPVVREHFALDAFRFDREPDVRELPSRLLAAHNQVVTFTGRADMLTDLTSWRNDSAPFAARLLHAPGGQGKTRIAAKFARDSAAEWLTLRARHRSEVDESEVHGSSQEMDKDVLIIADYADRWPARHLLALFTDPIVRDHDRKVRVLLLARSEEWWESLRHDLPHEVVADTRALGPLTPSERKNTYRTALESFVRELSPNHAPPRPQDIDLIPDKFGLALTVHMAALVAAYAHIGHDDRRMRKPADLSAYLLDREHAHWRRMAENNQITIRLKTMARAVFLATLSQGVDYSEGHDLVDQLRLSSSRESPEDVLDSHATCYPSADHDTVLTPLHPDRLGEDFLALQVPGHTVPGHPADTWAASAIERLLAPATPEYLVRRVLNTLVEAAARWEHLTTGHLCPLLQRYPELALTIGDQGLSAVVDLPGMDVTTLEAIERVVPPDGRADINSGIAALVRRLTDYRVTAGMDPANQAEQYQRLSWWLAKAGQDFEALIAAEASSQALRQLGRRARMSRVPPAVPASMIGAGVAHAHLANLRESQRVIADSVTHYRNLPPAERAKYSPEYASALADLSSVLAATGQVVTAAAAATEAVDIYRDLADQSPDFVPMFAAATDNLATIQTELGQVDEALSNAKLAVRLFAALTAADTPRYEADYAAASENLSAILAGLGREGEAVVLSGRAVEIFTRVADTAPAREAQLVSALTNHGMVLSAVGRHPDALTATGDAVTIAERLTRTDAAQFDRHLAKALFTFAAARLAAHVDLHAACQRAESSLEMLKRLTFPKTDIQRAERLVEDIQALLRGRTLPEGASDIP